MFSPETPYPLHGGGALRTASLLHYLARDYDVDLIVFRHRPEQDPAAALPKGLVKRIHVIDLPHHNRRSAARIWRNGARLFRGVPPLVDRFRGFSHLIGGGTRYKLAVVEHFWCAEYYDVLAPISDRVVLNLHNIESVWHGTCADAEPFPRSFAHRRFAKNCLQMEQHWLPKFDKVLTASEQDAERLRRAHPGIKPIVYPNAIPLLPIPEREEEEVIAFSGNMEYQPNRTAVGFFGRNVWPRLSEIYPALRWRLIGMNSHCVEREVRGLPRVEMTGSVADAVAELAAARVVVAPLLSGSGTRLKIVEAWAAGRAVVATGLGAEGLPITNNLNISIADSPRDFVESIQRLIEFPEVRKGLGHAGRCLYEQEFSWEAVWRKLDCSGLSILGKS
jgi:glycosyltransferase involved in cell wall biosynthesis